MMLSHDFGLIEKMVFVLILDAVKNEDQAILDELSISGDQVDLLKRVDKNLLFNNLDKVGSILSIGINEEAVKALLDKTLAAENYVAYIKEAILLGATHEILYKYASISSADFSKLRTELGLKRKRSATTISVEEADRLDKVIASVIKEQHKVKLSLTILVSLSKLSDIPINAIYIYLIEYWSNRIDI